MLNSGQQKGKVAQERQHEGNGPRADDMFARLQARCERHELEKFVHAKTEGDERVAVLIQAIMVPS